MKTIQFVLAQFKVLVRICPFRILSGEFDYRRGNAEEQGYAFYKHLADTKAVRPNG